MDYYSSMFIDNELNLKEKQIFIEKIHSDSSFYHLTMDLLEQDELIFLPEKEKKRFFLNERFSGILKPASLILSGFLIAVMLNFLDTKPADPPIFNNRFVLFEPAAEQVELAGSFTGWEKIPLRQIGSSGYWEINLPIPSGEYRFSYILNGDQKITDPTLSAREQDDFGGENSIINIGSNHS